MLEIVSPHALVSVTVWPGLGSFTFHLSINEFTFVLGVVWPYHGTVSDDVVLVELSNVNFASVREIVLALTFKLAIFKFTLIVVSVELKSALSGLLGFFKVSIIPDRAVVPSLNTLTVVLIILPFSVVHGS